MARGRVITDESSVEMTGLYISDIEPRLEHIKACYQCGACTGICPGAELYPGYNPRKIINLLSSALKSDTGVIGQDIFNGINPAHCFQCYSCENICPRGVSPGAAIKYLRENIKENGNGRHQGIFDKNLRKYGQSVIPDIFKGAEKIWGSSWKKVQKRKEFKHDQPRRRDISSEIIRDLNHILDFSSLLELHPANGASPKKLNLKDVHNLVLFESCCGSSHYPGIERSSKYVLGRMGIGYRTYEEQTCCGGFAYYANDIGLNEMVLINARNQSLIDSEDTVISFNCTSCFSTNVLTSRLLSVDRNRSQIKSILAEIDMEVSSNLHMAHLQQVLYDNIELVKDKLELDFSGLRIATHSGCHYRHFNQIMEDTSLDELVAITGAKVIDYSLKDRCCGGGFEKSFIGEIDKVRKINYDKQYSIAESGADLVVVNCPGCEMTFDRNSRAFKGNQPFDIGYLHITEFLALAMGADPFKVAGIQYHTAYAPLLNKFGFLKVIR